MKQYISILVAVLCASCLGLSCFAACPSMDVTGDCKVNLADFAVFASQWLTEGTPTPILYGMTWVSINDTEFTGEMSKYETTNAQYCEYLNAALASGDIGVIGSYAYGRDGSNSGTDFVYELYYYFPGSGNTYNGATNGGAARINYSNGVFTVDSGFENHPVTYVSWYGATAFCSYYGWRLPTESEWQTIADYDGSFTYGCGTTIDNSKANYQNSNHPDGTTAIGAFGTDGYGMCDMAGNVWEWTSNCYYPDCSYGYRVIRGGGWSNYYAHCTVSQRNSLTPDSTHYDYGFRVCR